MQQYIVFITLAAVLILFIHGRLRYDLVSVLALVFLTILGIVPGDEAFSGFSHPAVITVAAVLILSRALMNSGVVDSVVRLMGRIKKHPELQFGILISAVVFFSAFMNNIGALALFMPVAIRMARRNKKSPSLYLMPLAFGSLLGGLITQIGTPPNIIISIFREEASLYNEPFTMFDFAPVGIVVAFIGVLFIFLIGWRLIPRRSGQVSTEDLFEIDSYLTEVYIPEGSDFAGKRLIDLGKATEGDIVVVGHVRNDKKMPLFSPFRVFEEDDHIIIKANAEDLKELLDVTGLKLAGSGKVSAADLSSEEMNIVEAVINANSPMERKTARSLNLRSIYGINLLGISRGGARLDERLDSIMFRAGDVLLLQGRSGILRDVVSSLGCLPLVERNLKLGQSPRALLCVAIFAAALAVTAMGWLPIQISFVAAVAVMVMSGFVTLREAYGSIEWPIIVLLGAMIPVSNALETTGGAQLVGETIYRVSGSFMPWVTLTLLITITLLLSNVVNNAAAALLMAPIALSIAGGMGASSDPFLMCVAVGASCAFLTPIGHQSNTLVMGPGGYKFGDYWRMGLPLSLLVIMAAVPLIMHFWPM